MLPGTGLLAPGSMLYYQYRLKLPPGVSVGGYRAQLAKAFPKATWRVRDFRNAAPRLQELINRLALFLTLVGLTALLVGGVESATRYAPTWTANWPRWPCSNASARRAAPCSRPS